MSTTAIIPARGGSKGILHKNIAPLGGRPLITYTIDAALHSGVCDRCIVSTDDDAIARVSVQAGAEVVRRPKELAGDSARSQEAVVHVLRWLEEERGGLPEFFILLQPTSPLRSARHVAECFTAFKNSNAASVISVTQAEVHPQKCLIVENGYLEPLFSVDDLSRPRQGLPVVFRQNGAIYAMASRVFLKELTFYVPPVLPYAMPQELSIDIDSPLDLRMCEEVLHGKCQIDSPA